MNCKCYFLTHPYSGYRVVVSSGGGGTNHIHVQDYATTSSSHCGSTLFNQVASEVSYSCAAGQAWSYRSQVNSDRGEVVVGIGRAVGNIAAHELGHQLRLPAMDTTFDPNTYDYYTADTPSIAYGQKHWNKLNQESLDKRYTY